MKENKQHSEEEIKKQRKDYEAKIPKDQLLIPKKFASQKELKPVKRVTTKQMQNRKMIISGVAVIGFAITIYILLTALSSSSHFMDPVVYYNKAIVEQDESQLSMVLPAAILDSKQLPTTEILADLNERGLALGGEGYTIVEYLVEKQEVTKEELANFQQTLNNEFSVDLKLTKAYKVILDTTFKNDTTSNTVREELYVYQVNKVWYWFTLDLLRDFSSVKN
jgi:hypothetical protein